MSLLAILPKGLFPDGSLRSRLASGAMWTAIGSISFQVAAMATSISTARILGDVSFGELSIVRSTVVLFGVLAGTGLGLPTTKFIAQHRTIDSERAGRLLGLIMNFALVLSAFAAVLCVVLAEPLSERLLNTSRLTIPLRIGALLMAANVLNGVQMAALSGFEQFRTMAVINVVDGLLAFAGMTVGAWLLGVTGAIGGAAAAAWVMVPVRHIALLRHCRRVDTMPVHRGLFSELPAIWSTIVPAFLLGVSTQPFDWLARLLLTRENGFAQMGVFAAAYSWGVVVPFLSNQVTAPALPILTNLFGARDYAGFLRVLRGVALGSVGLTLLTSLPIMLLSRFIMRAYGTGFGGAAAVLTITVLAFTIAPLSAVFRVALIATGNIWAQNLHAVVWGLTLLSSYLLMTRLAARGLAMSYLVAYAVVVVTQGTSVALVLRRVRRER